MANEPTFTARAGAPVADQNWPTAGSRRALPQDYG